MKREDNFARDFVSFTSVTPFLTNWLNFKYLLHYKISIHSSIPNILIMSFLALYCLRYLILKVGSFFWDTMSVTKMNSEEQIVKQVVHAAL